MNLPNSRSPEQADAPGASKPDTPAAWFEAGLRLMQAGHIAQAEQCGRSALALDQGHADSLHLMGMLCIASKEYDLAIEWFAMAVRQNPNVPDYFTNLGMALQRKERLGEAIRCYDRSLTINKEQPELWFRMAELLRQEKRIDEAILSFDQALNLKSDYWVAANAAAILYFEAGRYEEAAARFTRSVEVEPDQAGAQNFVCRCLWYLRRYEEALPYGRKAIALAPDDADIAKNVGLILQKLDQQEEALVWFDKALALRPDYGSALNDRSTTLFALGHPEEALADIDRAVALEPEHPEYRWNRALMHLLVGRFDEGWPAREWGRKCGVIGFVDRNFTQPRWWGDDDIAGKTVLLHADEGLGDTIQFARYAEMVAARGANVVLEVEKSLHPLLTGIAGASVCVPRGTREDLPDFDLHCPLSAAPLAFKTRLETIPARRAYLPPLPQAKLNAWQARLGAHDRLRVGVVWSGNPLHGNDRNRSTNLRAMSAIFDPRARFYSLQKEPRPEDKATLAERTDLIDFTGHLDDFVDTAALIACLDLVIAVDTSVAHLAAAMGAPTWLLLPLVPDYRWLIGRDESPWYPTMRLFRQDASRDYAKVLARVREELGTVIESFAPTS
jgi:tetratricopeptide (TPR) repeat protein